MTPKQKIKKKQLALLEYVQRTMFKACTEGRLVHARLYRGMELQLRRELKV